MTYPKVLVGYSHQDEAEKEQLLAHLGVLRRAGLVGVWPDGRLGMAEKLVVEAKVIILLVTEHFLTSDFLHDEVVSLLAQCQTNGLTVFPVIARSCQWQGVGWLVNMISGSLSGMSVWGHTAFWVDDRLALIAAEIAKLIADFEPQQQTPVWHILVVEDEPNWQRRLKRLLEEINCTVTIAGNYEEAETQLAQNHFDLITIDLNLDKSIQYADGLELLMQIRKTFGPQFPTIVISGTGDMEDQRRAFRDYKVFDFIEKAKLDLEEFRITVTEAIGGT